MLKYTANYTYTNPNFTIQNLEKRENNSDMLPLLYVVKNLLQRGFPTVMSKYLQGILGSIQEKENYEERLLLVPKTPPQWFGVIKGDEHNQYNPARDFLETIVPSKFGEYAFVQSMLLPEIKINDITGIENSNFTDQQVDFYLPQALLVIEIDGSQHPEKVQNNRDYNRDNYLKKFGIETIRISTTELNHNCDSKIRNILNRLAQYETNLRFYRLAFEKITNNSFSEEEIHDKLLPTAIIRFQLLFLELLANDYIKFGETWKFNIKCDEPLGDFAKLAIEDVYIWLNNLVMLRDKHELPKFDYDIKVCGSADFNTEISSINIDFSLLQRYTNENILNPNTIYVRTDYFDFSEKRIKKGKGIGIDKNYFCVSTAQSIDYNITDRDKPTLRFFLQNLFNKRDFREGQFAIIANALNLRDTIGLLPTGGGKSLCFQLPCLLQPSINFVICPIKSLMYDQIDNLKRGDVKITNVELICGDLKPEERMRILYDYSNGKYLFIWISPERFQIQSFRASFKTAINKYNISYAVIDEVHCMSEWGHDFRTSYLNLAKTIDGLSPKDKNGEGSIKYIGLTATASVNVLKDIKIEFSRRKQQLEEDNIKTLLDYTRPELDFYVINDERKKWKSLTELLEKEKITEDKSKATLIFTPNVNGRVGCYQLAQNLTYYFADRAENDKEHNLQPVSVAWYSGSVPAIVMDGKKMPLMKKQTFDEYKKEVQEDFKNDKYQILCATKAFGMGIDKQNIFYTIHYGLPSSVEALYQEAGRAGRWDKSLAENREKRGKCYVLHSPESEEMQPYLERALSVGVSIESLDKIVKEKGNNGEDIFKQLFLFLNGTSGMEKEYNNIVSIISMFYQEGVTLEITYDQFKNELQISEDSFEKEIYRLCLLGIADDWTRDFINSFTVKFNSIDEQHIIESLKKYILKYDPDEKVEENIRAVIHDKCDTFWKKAIWYLLEWIFRHITESRKQSLKTLSDWCLDFKDSDSFKHRIEAYFTFNESTYILQHVAEHSQDYAQWFAAFYNNKAFITKAEVRKLRDRLSRFLESYHNSPGLNFISGMVRLLMGDFEDTDGRLRMESALKNVAEVNANNLMENGFSTGIVQFIRDANLKEEQCTELCSMIAQYFPELLSIFAEEFDLPWLFNDIIKENINQLRNINLSLYEQIGRI